VLSLAVGEEKTPPRTDLGHRSDARVASQQCPILRPVRFHSIPPRSFFGSRRLGRRMDPNPRGASFQRLRGGRRKRSGPLGRWCPVGSSWEASTEGASDLAIELLFRTEQKICCALERRAIPSRARASGSKDLPWALPRILQTIPKIKGPPADGSGGCAGHGCGGACSRNASSAFGRDARGSAIAATDAGRRRGLGHGGRRRRGTGAPRPANRNATDKAVAIGSASGTVNRRLAKPFRTPRG
jgi:hypothetical protein